MRFVAKFFFAGWHTANISLVFQKKFCGVQSNLQLTDPFLILLTQLAVLPCSYLSWMLKGMPIDIWRSKLLCRQV